MKNKSEFGKGLVICLVKFSEHINQHNKLFIYDYWIKQDEVTRKNMLSERPDSNHNYGFQYMQSLKTFVEIADKIYEGDYEKKLSNEIEMLMNGASDHLYEIEVPKGKSWDKIRKLVNKLRDSGLEIGHGFNNDARYTIKDFYGLFELTKKISLEIDKKLGLKGDEGDY